MKGVDEPLPERTRTWLVAVFHKGHALLGENLVGSRNYIPRLLEICHIIATNVSSLEGYEVIMVRDNWRGELRGDDIKKFAAAYAHAMSKADIPERMSRKERNEISLKGLLPN